MKTTDLNAERSLLGSILLNDKLAYYVELIKSKWFSDGLHRNVFEAMKELRKQKREIDPVTVISFMKGSPSDNYTLIDSITSAHITSVGIDGYIRLLQELSLVRELRLKCQHVIAGIESSEQDPMVFVTDSASIISDVGKDAVCSRTEKANTGIIEMCDDIISGAQPKGLVKTGFTRIDKVFGGLWPEMTILGGRPGMGKTALGLALAKNIGKTSNSLYISLEESKQSLQQRLLAMASGVRVNDIRRRDLRDGANRALINGAGKINDLNLWIHHEPGISIEEIGAICKRFQSERELGIVVIDHMDRIKGKGNDLGAREDVSKGLADMIGLGGFPGLVLHQLNKQCESRDDKRPHAGDLRYVGEADARAIWFVYRDSVYNPTSDHYKMEVIIGKNNNGPCGIIPLWCDLETMQFSEWRGPDESESNEPY